MGGVKGGGGISGPTVKKKKPVNELNIEVQSQNVHLR